MSEIEPYIQISLTVLKHINKPLAFDIYVKRTETNYTKILRQDDMIDWKRISNYVKKGIKVFYVQKEDYDSYTLYVEKLGNQLISSDSKSFTPAESIRLLKEMVSFTMHELINNSNVNERMVSSASNVVTGCIDGIAKNPKMIFKVISLMGEHTYLFRHSITTSILSVILAKAAGITTDTALNHVGLGGFLHDVGIGQLSFSPEAKDILTPEERKEIGRHPALGVQQLDSVKGIRSEVLKIVIQHHEQPNGHGYPNNLRGPEIYYLAKMVSIADSFSSMVAERSFRDRFTAEEALVSMKNSTGKFDKELLDTFIETLRPKLLEEDESI